MLLRISLLLLALAAFLPAHVGINEVYWEGLAGPYPVNVVIRPPSVIPGVAEVDVRVLAQDVNSLRLTPMTLTGAGAKFPPTPEPSTRSAQDPQFWSGSVWIMAPGSWQIRLLLSGARGETTASVPVVAASRKAATMDTRMAGILIVLISLLVIGGIGIAGAAATEARLAPGMPALPSRRLWWIRAASLLLAAGILWLGWSWWDAESREYANSLYKPVAMDLVQNSGQLTVKLRHTGWFQNKSLDGLLEEHGHRMHLFLIHDANPSSLHHLHPIAQRAAEFDFQLPPLHGGTYRAFADIVHPNGFAETLVAQANLSPVAPQSRPAPPDDASLQFPIADSTLNAAQPSPFSLPNGWTVRFLPGPDWKRGKALKLRFQVLDSEGNLVKNLRPYLGMPGHLIIFRKDFSVFAHLHPSGTPSMRALEMGARSLSLANEQDTGMHGEARDSEGDLAFPFGFTQPGAYRAVLQFRDSKQIYSAAFDFYIQ